MVGIFAPLSVPDFGSEGLGRASRPAGLGSGMAGAAKKRPDFVGRERENGYLYRPFFPRESAAFFFAVRVSGPLGALFFDRLE